ncbi:NAD(P)/FAD-dependent oxidoreductase [Mucilaginibacter sp. AW1-3]
MGHNYSYWEQTAFLKQADVVVIGSGIVGLNAALQLKTLQPALNVLVLERGFLPSGASTKNAGFACFGTVSEQLELLKHATEAEVVQMVDYKYRGLKKLREKLGDQNIGYEEYGGYELFMDNHLADADEGIAQIDYLNNLLKPVIGRHDIYAVANEKIADFGFKGASRMIYNSCEGQIHTGKMMRALLARAQGLGVLVLNNCEVERIEHHGRAIHIITAQGVFETTKVIVATNAFTKQLFPQLDVIPGRGQVLITKPIDGLKLKGTYHFDEGYYYFRNIDGRVLFGGGRNLDFAAEQTTGFGHTDKIKQKLLDYLQYVILPGQRFEVDYWWSGIMGFGEDIHPIIKQVEPNVFCAVRCNGMGVAMGTLVGEQVAELALNS